MKLIANDTLNISAVKAGNIEAGEAFEIEAGAGKSLIERGLAIEFVETPAKPVKAK